MKYQCFKCDMIELYKILTAKYDTCCMAGLTQCGKGAVVMHVTRSNRVRFPQIHCKYNVTQHFVVNQCVPILNSLPDNVVTTENMNVFKNYLDKYWSNQDILYNHKLELKGTGSHNTRNI